MPTIVIPPVFLSKRFIESYTAMLPEVIRNIDYLIMFQTCLLTMLGMQGADMIESLLREHEHPTQYLRYSPASGGSRMQT